MSYWRNNSAKIIKPVLDDCMNPNICSQYSFMEYFMDLIHDADRVTVNLPKTSIGRALCQNMTLDINFLNDSQTFETI